MNILVVGASGATGRFLVEQLLNRGQKVKAIVRSAEKLNELLNNKDFSVIQASILELSETDLAAHVLGCDAIVSCLGHNLNLKGIFGHPRRLVTDATHRLCNAVASNMTNQPVKFILMNTSGNRNRDIPEPISMAEKVVIALLRMLVPPHVDNENAADYLRTNFDNNNTIIEWISVRPDTLVDEKNVSPYNIYPSPIRSAIFNAGKTSRINVAHFMAELICNNNIWIKWKGQMPVIYNSATES